MELFPHALRPVFVCGLYWSFEYLAMIFVYALSSQRHYSLHRSVAALMAYSVTFDYNYRRMASNAFDFELDLNSYKCLASCMNLWTVVLTTLMFHNLHKFDPTNHLFESYYWSSAVEVVRAQSNGFHRFSYVNYNCYLKKITYINI